MKKKKNLFFILFSIFVSFSNLNYAQNFKFAAMSDSRGNYNGVNEPVLSALVQHLLKKNSDVKFLVFPGDLVNGNKLSADTTEKQLENWKRIMSPIYDDTNMVWPRIWMSVGNHEIQNSKDENLFREEFQNVYMNGPEDEKGLTYSFDYENVHFVFVTTDKWHYSEADEDGSRDWHYVKHLDWLANDLKAARERGNKYIFVMSHETAFPIGGHLKDGLPNLGNNLTLPLDSTRQWYLNQRDKFWKILSDNKATAYICGHEHIYGRESVNGVYQITAGSCGAPLYYFNPTMKDIKSRKYGWSEFHYQDALPYYKALNYNYGPDGNAQASIDFVGKRAFVYVALKVTPNFVEVKTYGAYPKKDSDKIIGSKIQLLDSFKIKRKL